MTRRIATGVVLAMLPWAGGCQLAGLRQLGGSLRPAKEVDEIFVQLSPPTALNWDERPGPDGLQARVNFFRHDEDFSVPVDGTLEFELYEGRPPAESPGKLTPFCTWRFEKDELDRHLGKTMVGWGYEMRLPWERPPKASTVTLVAKHHAAGGGTKTSKPLFLALTPK